MVKVALFGLGVVGSSVVKILQKNKDIIKQRCGKEIVPVIACVKNANKKRDVRINTTTDVNELFNNDSIDIFVELMGGVDEPFLIAKKILSKNKFFVTANKAMLAYHRYELESISKKSSFEFEAAIGGGIPIVSSLREGLCSNHIISIKGILNGTCNYILTRMKNELNLKYKDALKDAQKLGYAEFDPALDVGGYDAAHKLLILGSIAYGIDAKVEDILIEGIENITNDDIFFAKEFGYVIKLLAIGKEKNGEVELRVHPAFINEDILLAKVDGVMNGISINSDMAGETLYYGAGAGGDATASAVVANIIDIVKKQNLSSFTPLGFVKNDKNTSVNSNFRLAPKNKIKTKYYLRLKVEDKSGILATVCRFLSDENISIKNFFQREKNEDNKTAILLISTHTCLETSIKKALANLEKSNLLLDKAALIRIED